MTRQPRLALAAGLLAAALSCHAAGVVEVSFVEPRNYIDAGLTSKEIERTTNALSACLKQFGAALPDGQTLRIEVLDVDLAGRVRMGSRADTRIMHGDGDWPRIKLRYTLQAGGQILKSGEETVLDMDYLNPSWHVQVEQALPYEQRMLSRWFEERFGGSRAQ